MCKKFENRLRFDKVTESLKVGTFLRHSVREFLCTVSSHVVTSVRYCVPASLGHLSWGRVGDGLDTSMDWIGLDCYLNCVNQRTEEFVYTVEHTCNSKTTVVHFKGRLMSVFESILLVFDERAAMIQFLCSL